MADVEVYTQPGCPFCTRAKRILETKGVPYREIHAPHGSPERAQAAQRSGGRGTVPQIFVGGAHVGGCDDLQALDRAGRLEGLLKAA